MRLVEPERASAALRRWALEAGFDRAGIARLEPSSHGRQLRAWLEDGSHAGMAYLSRRTELRLDPRQIFPGARSAVCVALQYSPLLDDLPADGDLWSRVARYARGVDYHDLMKTRLEALAQKVHAAFPACSTRGYVDTGPVLEREIAARAGLGAFGKNTMLLNEDSGSWLLLGELLLSLELQPDVEITDLCGTCTQCLEACPTGALPRPYTLDANRCISYWTIEHRGVFPRAVRREMGGWVFGCDVCQEVCPWNGDALEVNHPELRLPTQRADLDLQDLLLITRDEYVERFRGSPMKRAKQEGLQRNAAVAMGNSRDATYLPALLAALNGESALVRTHVAWALGEIGGEEARSGLQERQSIEVETDVLREIERALSRLET